MNERPYWQRALYQIWPKIYRTINGVLFFIFQVIKSGVQIAIREIKQK